MKGKNRDLEQDLEKIEGFFARAHVVAELEPYRSALLIRIRQLLAAARQNLAWLGTEHDSLLADVLSETSTLVQHVPAFEIPIPARFV